jgi:Biotin carboxylase, N-terminal domain
VIESLLVVDDGLGAVRVIDTAHVLGVKAVLLTTSERASRAHGPDDVVLLAAEELTSAAAVVGAAVAAQVDAIHPAMGPLRADLNLAVAAEAAGMSAVVTRHRAASASSDEGSGSGVTAGALLSADGVPWRADVPAQCSVLVFGTSAGAVVLGDLCVEPDGVSTAPAVLDAPARELAHRTAAAAAAVLAVRGLVGVDVTGTDVVGLTYGLRPEYAAWEVLTGVDLVAVQLRAVHEDLPADGLELALAPDDAGSAATLTVEDDVAGPAPDGTRERLERYLDADGRPRTRLTVVAADRAAAVAALRDRIRSG